MVPLMSESLERRLSVLEHVQLRLHLMVCVWCARYLKQIEFLRELVGQRPAGDDRTGRLIVRLHVEVAER